MRISCIAGEAKSCINLKQRVSRNLTLDDFITDMQFIKLLSYGHHMDYQHIPTYSLVLDHTCWNILQKQQVMIESG